MFDLLIKSGQIVNGSGNPGYYGAVGVEGDRIRILQGDVSPIQVARVIDATGRVICPGFIDMHAHSGLMILANPRHEPKVFQGITTELIGVDGNSYAPMPSHQDLVQFIRLNGGLDGAPSLTQRWLSVAEYLSLFSGKVACNIAYIIGNSALRISGMGWEDRPPTPEELGQMKALLRQGMEEGACGISTGLDYPPGSYADTEELVELCKEASKLGGIYHTHVRYSLGDRFLDPFKEAIEIGRSSGIPVHITHLFQRMPFLGSAHKLIELMERARNEGLDVTFDTFPSSYGSTRLIVIFPQWTHSGGPDVLLEIIRSPEKRKELEQTLAPRATTWHEVWLTYLKLPHNKQWEGRSVAEYIEDSGKSPIDALCDLLIEEDLQTCYVADQNNPATMPLFLQNPVCTVGTDGVLLGDYPSPRTYGSFPHILGNLVRDEGFLTLPDAIRKMTSAPAQRLGLRDRGLLRDGLKADIVVFDPATITSPATLHNPRQFPVGIDYVIVNGTIVVEKGKHTGALPGQALHRGKSSQ